MLNAEDVGPMEATVVPVQTVVVGEMWAVGPKLGEWFQQIRSRRVQS